MGVGKGVGKGCDGGEALCRCGWDVEKAVGGGEALYGGRVNNL